MATLFKSTQSQAARPAPSLSQAGQAVAIRGFFALTAATVLNDTFQLVKLPANMVLEDLILDLDIVDSNGTPTAVLQVGVLNAAGTALLGPVLVATTAAQSAAGGSFRPTTLAAVRLTAKPYDRLLGVLTQTAPATGVAPTASGALKGAWQPSTVYATGDTITLPNGSMLKVTGGGGGTSSAAASQPEWNTVTASTTADNGLTWTAISVVIGLTARYRNQNYGA